MGVRATAGLGARLAGCPAQATLLSGETSAATVSRSRGPRRLTAGRQGRVGRRLRPRPTPSVTSVAELLRGRPATGA